MIIERGKKRGLTEMQMLEMFHKADIQVRLAGGCTVTRSQVPSTFLLVRNVLDDDLEKDLEEDLELVFMLLREG